jgi:hypothetical protein
MILNLNPNRRIETNTFQPAMPFLCVMDESF